MPWKDPEVKKQKAKEYYLKNKEKINKKNKENRLKKLDERKAKDREYYQKNKVEHNKRSKEYREKNKEELKEYNSKYRKTPKGIMSMTLSDWKRVGLINEDPASLYLEYLSASNCKDCGTYFGKRGDGTGTFKCMDHNHETGEFRDFVCAACNSKRR